MALIRKFYIWYPEFCVFKPVKMLLLEIAYERKTNQKMI